MKIKIKRRNSVLLKFGKIIINIILIILTVLSIFYIVATKLSPTDAPKFFGYKPYVILTNSMVPTLPVGSLVIDHAIDEDDPIPENTPITFKAELQGQEVFVTHYFRYIDQSDGYDRYMTQGEGYQEGQYDEFEIHREDIVGTYAFHIPYLGRVAMFLQSPAGPHHVFALGLYPHDGAHGQKMAVLQISRG